MLYLLLIFIVMVLCFSVSISTEPNNESNYLSQDKTLTLKGICALLIMFHHLVTSSNNLPIIFEPFKYIAFPLVSLFFFLSGFGLMESLKNKQYYLKNFFKKRICKLLIPYLIVVILFGIYIFIINNYSIQIGDFIKNIILAKDIGPLWYMTTIIILYIIFFFVYKYLDLKKGTNLILILTISYLLIGIYTKIGNVWLSSIIGFWFGLYFSLNENKLKVKLENNYLKSLLFFGSLFILLFVFRLIISLKITDAAIIHVPFRNLLCILFLITSILICMKINFKGKLLRFFGNISYEIYIIHPFLIFIFSKYITNNSVCILLIFFGTIFLSYILNLFNKLLSHSK